MDLANKHQLKAWNGDEGVAWAEAAGLDDEEGRNTKLSRQLIATAAIGMSDHVLDVGCGAGETTLLAARHASAGHVAGIDLSAPMLEQARLAATAASLGNVTFQQADAQVHPFAKGTFDAAISMYGVMFFADPVAAFANIGRALRAGGRLTFVCPQQPEQCAWYVIPVAALLAVPPQPHDVIARYPGARPVMFSLSDAARLDEVLTKAGFTAVSVKPTRVPHAFGRTAAEAADTFLASGPTRYIVEQDDELTWDEAHARLETALRAYELADGVLLPGAQWLVSACWTGESAA